MNPNAFFPEFEKTICAGRINVAVGRAPSIDPRTMEWQIREVQDDGIITNVIVGNHATHEGIRAQLKDIDEHVYKYIGVINAHSQFTGEADEFWRNAREVNREWRALMNWYDTTIHYTQHPGRVWATLQNLQAAILETGQALAWDEATERYLVTSDAPQVAAYAAAYGLALAGFSWTITEVLTVESVTSAGYGLKLEVSMLIPMPELQELAGDSEEAAAVLEFVIEDLTGKMP